MITQKFVVFLLYVTSIWADLKFASDSIVNRHSYQAKSEKVIKNQYDMQNNNAEVVLVDMRQGTVNSENVLYQVQHHKDPEIEAVYIDENVKNSDSDEYKVVNGNIQKITNYNDHKQTENGDGPGYQQAILNNSPEILVVDINRNMVNSEHEDYQVQDQPNPEIQVVDINGNIVNSINDKYDVRNRTSRETMSHSANDYSKIVNQDEQSNIRNDEQSEGNKGNLEKHTAKIGEKIHNPSRHHKNKGKIPVDFIKITAEKSVANSKIRICDTLECKNYAQSLLNSMDKTVHPCEDFYEYACGRWEESNPLPPYMLVWNSFRIADYTAQLRLKEIFESKPARSDILPVKQTKLWYQSCMDTETLEKKGIDPIISIMMKIGGWPMAMDEDELINVSDKWQDVDNYFANRTGSHAFWDIDATELPFTGQVVGGLRNFETGDYDRYQILVTKIVRLFARKNGASISDDTLSQDVKKLMLFEKAIFELQNVNPEQHVIPFFALSAKPLGRDKSSKEAINWGSVIQKLFHSATISLHKPTFVLIKNKGFIEGIKKLLTKTSRRTIVNYIHWNFIAKVFRFTNQNMREEFFHHLWDEIFELEEREPRWLQCVNEMKLIHAAAYAYVTKYFDPKIKSAAQEMVENIRVSLEKHIDSSNWMDKQSKILSKQKLNGMKVFVGFPDWYNKTLIIKYYKGIQIGTDYLDNNLSYMRYQKIQNLQLYLSPRPLVDPFITEGEDPLNSGGMYVRNLNYAEFPAVGFETQFFGMSFPNNVNYAKIGFIIGHEMGHAYDNCGITFGNNGNKTALSSSVLRSFYERVDCFVRQYDEFHNNPFVNGTEWKCDGKDQSHDNTDGQRTAGENIADTTGLQIVFQAYKNLSKIKNPDGEMRLPGLEEFTDDQLFFLSFANTWCEAEAPSYGEIRFFKKHPQMSLRVLGPVSNTKDFAKAFNCSPDSWMNPTDKCSVWHKPSD